MYLQGNFFTAPGCMYNMPHNVPGNFTHVTIVIVEHILNSKQK